MFRMLPPAFRSIIRLPTASVAWKVPFSTVETTALKPLGVRSSVVARKLPAALLTRTSIPPKRSSNAATIASTLAKSRTSHGCVATRPAGPISPAAAASRSALRPVMPTFAPSEANFFAIDRPSPEPPPVTSTVFPASRSSRNTGISRISMIVRNFSPG